MKVAILMPSECGEWGGSFIIRSLMPPACPPCPDCEAPSRARVWTGGPPRPRLGFHKERCACYTRVLTECL